ncbi:MAG: beta-galactosidase [Saccharofermentanales bacterium]
MFTISPPYLGAAYYPEGLSEEQVEQDIAQMKMTGINVVRLAEFAWSRLEPSEGHYDFSWLQNIVNRLAYNSIGVILCTPSATPPFWLSEKHPDLMPIRYDGHRASHGARLHYCPNNAIYRSFIRKFIREFAHRFAGSQSLIGWQIDNEVYIPFGEGCFCPDCEGKFHDFLQNRYSSIEQLNFEWQLTLWSQEYPSFSKIPMPRPSTPHHPSLKTAWLEYQELSVIEYVEEQIDLLKQFTDKPVSTDMMPLPFIDHARANRKTDVVMFNHYCSESSLPSSFFWFDYLKTLKDKPLWNTETDPNINGGVSMSGYKPRGFCTVNSWLPILFGGEANLYWHWRGHRAGHELMHGSVIDSFGRPTYTYSEIAKIAGDMAKCSEFIKGTHLKPSRVAIHYSAFAEKLFANQPICTHPGYWMVLFNSFYLPLIEDGIRVDIISTERDLTQYDIVISPMLPCLDDHNLRDRLNEWIEGGGIWIAGPLTDVRNRHCAKYDTPFSILESWGGIKLKYFAAPNPDHLFNLKYSNGNESSSGLWYDGFESEGATPLALYGNRSYEFEDLIAIAENIKGNGKVIILGTLPPEDDYLKIVRSFMKYETDSAPVSSKNVLCIPRSGESGDGFILAEYRNMPGTLELRNPAADLITGTRYSGIVKIPPYSIMVMKYCIE